MTAAAIASAIQPRLQRIDSRRLGSRPRAKKRLSNDSAAATTTTLATQASGKRVA